MTKIELIVSDLDGTLVEGETIANKADADMIKTLQDQNFNFIPATGRTWQAAKDVVKKLDVDKYCDLVICNNGAIVSKVSSFEPIYTKYININYVNEIALIADELNLCFYAFVEGGKVAFWNGVDCPSENLNAIGWPSSFSKTIIIDDIKNDNIVQVMVFVNSENNQTFIDRVSATKKELSIVKNDKEDILYYEFNNSEATKGNALKFVATYLKANLEKTIVFGDNFNDISMFSVAGTSVAVDNANDLVKNKATTTTLSYKDGGVSYYLYQIMMNMDDD